MNIDKYDWYFQSNYCWTALLIRTFVSFAPALLISRSNLLLCLFSYTIAIKSRYVYRFKVFELKVMLFLTWFYEFHVKRIITSVFEGEEVNWQNKILRFFANLKRLISLSKNTENISGNSEACERGRKFL